MSARLCPNCRALIDASAESCVYCGASVRMASVARAGDGLTNALVPSGRMAVALLLLVNCGFFIAISVSQTQILARLGAKSFSDIMQGDWYRLITAGYLHTWFMHILLNMFALYNLGPIVEEIFGTKRMFTIYTAATVVGFTASAMWQPFVPSLGASAGIFGLLGALIAYGVVSKSSIARHLQQQCLVNAAAGFLMGAFMPMIDNAAHAGGLAGGFLIAYLAGVPRWVDDAKEKLWTVMALVSLLLTLYAFYQLTMRVSAAYSSS